jgi:hypothetical protein
METGPPLPLLLNKVSLNYRISIPPFLPLRLLPKEKAPVFLGAFTESDIEKWTSEKPLDSIKSRG